MYSSPKYSVQYYSQHLKPYGYQVRKLLGSGAFAEVVLAIQDTNQYAIKCIRRKILKQKPQLLIYIKNQFQIMEVLDHPNILKQYGVIEDSQFYFIILEYCNIGNLLNFQAQLPSRKFSVKDTREVIARLIKGLKLVHDRGFIHRDIKPQNVLLKRENNRITFKIGDFGFARPIQNIVKTYCGTTNFMAPQILTDKPYTVAVDCWSLGVVMYFMLFAQLPFKGMDILTDIKRKCKNTFNLRKVTGSSEFIQQSSENLLSNFFERLFVIDGNKRMGLKEMMCHPLFSNFFQDQVLPKYKIQKLKSRNSTDDSSEEEPMFKSQKKQVDFQLQKLMFIKDTITLLCENNEGNLTNIQQLSLHYYLLKAYLFYSQQLLNNLTLLNSPVQNDCITKQSWVGFCGSEIGISIAKQLANNVIINFGKFEQIYQKINQNKNEISIKFFKQSFTQQIQQKQFEQFKTSYRAVVGYIFKRIHEQKQYQGTLQFQIKLRLFCCHLINRVFEHKNIKSNLAYYFQWLKNNKIQGIFENVLIKKWILTESKENLDKTINLLYQKYMASK